MNANPVFLTTVRLVPIGGAKLRDNATSFPAAAWDAAVTGTVEAEVKFAVTVPASHTWAKPRKRAKSETIFFTVCRRQDERHLVSGAKIDFQSNFLMNNTRCFPSQVRRAVAEHCAG